MTEFAYIVVLLTPISAAVLNFCMLSSRLSRAIVGWSAGPALFAAVFSFRDGAISNYPVLAGSLMELDETGRLFLLFSAILWLAAGIYGTSYVSHIRDPDRFLAFFCMTMTGNFGLILAQDMMTFLTFYAMMSFSAYVLIIHNRNPSDIRAGKVYISLAVVSEVALFSGMVYAASTTGSVQFDRVRLGLAAAPDRNLIAGLILFGFAIKLGLVPVHVWLPMAHPAAPTPASAVLSGAIIKTGLLGLLRILPFGIAEFHLLGAICAIGGLFTAFYGVLVGFSQNNPKTILAYSSISQMGVVTFGVGTALVRPDAWVSLQTIILIYACHHALAKAALFLGVGLSAPLLKSHRGRVVLTIGVGIPALALAGAPLTNGASLKSVLKFIGASVPGWPGVSWLLAFSSVATGLLMIRFVTSLLAQKGDKSDRIQPGMIIPWASLLLLLVFLRELLGLTGVITNFPKTDFTLKAIWTGLWPILTSVGIIAVINRPEFKNWRITKWPPPPGDIVIVVEWVWKMIREINRRLRPPGLRLLSGRRLLKPSFLRRLDSVERSLENWYTVTVAAIIMILLFSIVQL